MYTDAVKNFKSPLKMAYIQPSLCLNIIKNQKNYFINKIKRIKNKK